ncbi:MAG: hypothetical protein JWP52_3181, partial [Rhizobacter sp.]|nr:hypothetical protein [Rhizobacter sp.]
MTEGRGTPALPATPGWKRWWPVARRVLALAFAALVLTLLFIQAREVHWAEVFALIADYPGRSLFTAAALAASSYAVYCCFELLARRYTGHRLPKASVFGVAFVSYA